MKYHSLFSGKNKKNIINLSSAENTQKGVKGNTYNGCMTLPLADFLLYVLTIFQVLSTNNWLIYNNKTRGMCLC